MNCTHDDTTPVYAVIPTRNADPRYINGGDPIGYACSGCAAMLPAITQSGLQRPVTFTITQES